MRGRLGKSGRMGGVTASREIHAGSEVGEKGVIYLVDRVSTGRRRSNE